MFRELERSYMQVDTAWTVRTSRAEAKSLSSVVLVPTHRSGSLKTTLQPANLPVTAGAGLEQQPYPYHMRTVASRLTVLSSVNGFLCFSFLCLQQPIGWTVVALGFRPVCLSVCACMHTGMSAEAFLPSCMEFSRFFIFDQTTCIELLFSRIVTSQVAR